MCQCREYLLPGIIESILEYVVQTTYEFSMIGNSVLSTIIERISKSTPLSGQQMNMPI